jgi:hypothetical protein
VRETVWLRRLSTPSDRLLVSTTDQVPARSHMGANLPARTHMDYVPAPPEAPLMRSGETAGKTSRLSQIQCLFLKACFFTLVVAGLSDCSSMVYAPKAAVRTSTVRSSTVKQMEALDMDRASPILIRIYKEERTLETWKQDRSGKFALLNS